MEKEETTGIKGSVRTLIPEWAMAISTAVEKGEPCKVHSVPRQGGGGFGVDRVDLSELGEGQGVAEVFIPDLWMDGRGDPKCSVGMNRELSL